MAPLLPLTCGVGLADVSLREPFGPLGGGAGSGLDLGTVAGSRCVADGVRGGRPATLCAVRSPSRTDLEAMVAEATIDCYNDSECVTGFYTMIDEHLEVPFQTEVLGVDVTVTGIDMGDDDQIVAICSRCRWRQRIPILDLPLPAPSPGGAEWIEAYRHWLT